jgi:hypothetical protein
LSLPKRRAAWDNFWHGVAVKDGAEVNVVLTPNRKVKREGN